VRTRPSGLTATDLLTISPHPPRAARTRSRPAPVTILSRRAVILLETGEESGSPDLPDYLEHLRGRLGDVWDVGRL
jgi:hypothetical protein